MHIDTSLPARVSRTSDGSVQGVCPDDLRCAMHWWSQRRRGRVAEFGYLCLDGGSAPLAPIWLEMSKACTSRYRPSDIWRSLAKICGNRSSSAAATLHCSRFKRYRARVGACITYKQVDSTCYTSGVTGGGRLAAGQSFATLSDEPFITQNHRILWRARCGREVLESDCSGNCCVQVVRAGYHLRMGPAVDVCNNVCRCLGYVRSKRGAYMYFVWPTDGAFPANILANVHGDLHIHVLALTWTCVFLVHFPANASSRPRVHPHPHPI